MIVDKSRFFGGLKMERHSNLRRLDRKETNFFSLQRKES